MNASTLNAAPAGSIPPYPCIRWVAAPNRYVMRDRMPQRRRFYPQATYNGGALRTLVRIYLCVGLIVAFLVVVP